MSRPVSLYQCWSSQENISGEYKPDPSEHCAAYSLGQCAWCKAYQAGREPARFPPPMRVNPAGWQEVDGVRLPLITWAEL